MQGERLTLDQSDFGETPEAGDHFGWSVALNRTDIGGCYGILVSSPGEDIDGLNRAGMGHRADDRFGGTIGFLGFLGGKRRGLETLGRRPG